MLTGTAASGLFLRYNGYYILMLIAVILIIYAVSGIRRHSVSVKNTVIIVALVIISMVCMKWLTTSLTKQYVAKEISGRAKYALLIQQLGRCAAEHPESFSDADRGDIEAVMGIPLEQVAERYDPYSFDSLKGGFNVEASKTQMTRFRQVWLKMVKKHPMTCVNATLQQNYYLFSIFARNSRYYHSFYNGSVEDNELWNYSDLYTISASREKCQTILLKGYQMFEYIPFVGLLANHAIYMVILFVVFLRVISSCRLRWLILLMPLLGTIGIIIIGPALKLHGRYFFPIVYCMPVMLSALIMDINILRVNFEREI